MEARDRQRIGAAFAERRGYLGLTQDEAAQRAGVGVTTWRLIEGGKAQPRPTTLAAIARALNWPPDAASRLARGETPPTMTTPAEPEASGSTSLEARLALVERSLVQLHARLDELDVPAADRVDA